jgi:DNA-binding MarR family transcriptional regulator
MTPPPPTPLPHSPSSPQPSPDDAPAPSPNDAPPSGAPRDWTDRHVERWLPVLPGLDPDIEGAVTRVNVLTDHLRRVRERSLADFDLHKHEFDTLHSLAGRGGRAVPSELAADLKMAPGSVTGRLDALERRGYVRRTPSAEDRRRVDVELTPSGHAAWLGAMDVVGHEEYRLLGVLSADERRTLSDLLRRVLLVAERT